MHALLLSDTYTFLTTLIHTHIHTPTHTHTLTHSHTQMKRSASIDNDLISAQTAPSCIDGTKRYRDCNNTAIYAQPQHR